MNRPVHFEIPAGDIARARKFFEAVFGWTFTEWSGGAYWLISTGPADQKGIDGGMLQRQAESNPLCNTIEVADLDKTVKAVEANGGAIAMPRMPVPGIGWLAYFKDTEGNLHGLLQPDSAAG